MILGGWAHQPLSISCTREIKQKWQVTLCLNLFCDWRPYTSRQWQAQLANPRFQVHCMCYYSFKPAPTGHTHLQILCPFRPFPLKFHTTQWLVITTSKRAHLSSLNRGRLGFLGLGRRCSFHQTAAKQVIFRRADFVLIWQPLMSISQISVCCVKACAHTNTAVSVWVLKLQERHWQAKRIPFAWLGWKNGSKW